MNSELDYPHLRALYKNLPTPESNFKEDHLACVYEFLQVNRSLYKFLSDNPFPETAPVEEFDEGELVWHPHQLPGFVYLKLDMIEDDSTELVYYPHEGLLQGIRIYNTYSSDEILSNHPYAEIINNRGFKVESFSGAIRTKEEKDIVKRALFIPMNLSRFKMMAKDSEVIASGLM